MLRAPSRGSGRCRGSLGPAGSLPLSRQCSGAPPNPNLPPESFLQLLKQTSVHDLVVKDFVDCAHGSVSGCLWAASTVLPFGVGKLGKLADLAKVLRGADAVEEAGILANKAAGDAARDAIASRYAGSKI